MSSRKNSYDKSANRGPARALRISEVAGRVGISSSALRAWERLEAHAESENWRQTMRLHEANVLIKMENTAQARRVLATVTLADLDAQKQKLVAQLPPGQGK